VTGAVRLLRAVCTLNSQLAGQNS